MDTLTLSKIKSTPSDARRITCCRACRSPLLPEPLYALGNVPVVSFPEKASEPILEAPLNILACSGCGLAQLEHTVSPETLFRHFWYRSGVTRSMTDALLDVFVKAHSYCEPMLSGDSVLDIGSNDGTLLSMFPSTLNRVGYEPATDIAREAAAKGLEIVPECFSLETLRPQDRCRFKMIFAIAMFYDIDDLAGFMQAVRLAIKPQGIFVVQMNYLGSMLKNLAVDNIVHEHLTYFSARAFEHVIESQGFAIVSVETNDVNGGSVRFVCKLQRDIQPEAATFIEKEDTGLDAWDRFTIDLSVAKSKLLDYFSCQAVLGKYMGLAGASTRGLTTMHFLGLDSQWFLMASERDPNKHYRFYGSTGIKIIPEALAREAADIMLVLPWHFEREIIEREHGFLDKGGTLVFPFPAPKLVTKEGEKLL